MRLWYKTPAKDWLNGLPIGNGRIAAMVMGTARRERIALNHEWLWRGTNRNRDTEVRNHLLPEVRKLLLAGDYAEGTRAANAAFAGDGGVSGRPGRVDPYQPAGDFYVEFDDAPVRDYTRALDLRTASVKVAYDNGARHTRTYMAHLVEDVILVRVEQGGVPFDCTAWLDRRSSADCVLKHEATAELLIMDGSISGGVDFRVQTAVWHKGGEALPAEGRKLLLRGVTEAVFAIDIGVSARGKTAAGECNARKVRQPVDWDALFAAHVRENEKHFGSMSLDLQLEAPALPTDERIRRLRAGEPDPDLALLYFNFGRYLLCASSALGSLPANLQGKWNEELQPPWESDYHHDVNLQMSYWIAEPAGMQRYTEALLQHIERFVPHARKAARDLYGCRGIVYPIQTDAWGRATPESYGWAAWIGAAPWLAQHMWWHYEFAPDPDFLRNRAYPFFKEVAAFYEDYLVADEKGVLQIVPSQSPENRFAGGGDLPVSIGVSSTMDVILARESLRYAIRSAELLAVDPDKRRQWQGMLDRLPQLKIGRHGQLQEWNADFEEVEPAHRHVSHLVGLFPGDMLDRERTPELWRAAEVSLERRLAAGGGHTGWSRAWTACLFARLGRPRDAWEHLNHLITDFATDTLLDLHPPRIFQIDGNLGGAAAVLEMLLQSEGGELRLLPALPAAWPDGSATGLRARGGFTVGMTWKKAVLEEATIKGLYAGPCSIANAPANFRVADSAGQPVATKRSGSRLAFDVKPGSVYRLAAPGSVAQ